MSIKIVYKDMTKLNMQCIIYIPVRSTHAEKFLKKFTRFARSRDLTIRSHKCRKVVEFRLNEENPAGGSQPPDLMMAATRRETRSMTEHMREVE
jgi:hypothetical protein